MTPDEIRSQIEMERRLQDRGYVREKDAAISMTYSALMEIALQLAEMNEREQERVEKIYAALSGEPPHAD